MSPRRAAQTVARAAALIAVLTVLARVVGFARNIVFSNAVGQTCLGQTYQTTNTIPNIVFEIVAGGALASVVVPLISSFVAKDDHRSAAQTASALMSWTIAVLVPVSLLIGLLARPLSIAILGEAPCSEAVDAGTAMLRIFAPQVVLYGVGIVLTGVLQAYKRFGGPAIAPLLSSLVVIAAYLLFAAVAGRGAELGAVSAADQAILSVGTTLGVVALTLSLLVPLRGTPIRLRPTFHFPPGQARRARAMVAAGIAGLVAQQLFIGVTLVLANQTAVPPGAINVFMYAQTIYLLPWAVLAVPIATSVFPRLAEAVTEQRRGDLQRLLSGAHVAIAALSGIAIAALVAAASEISVVFVSRSPGEPSVDALTHGLIGFSMGLAGYSAFALHSRALFAMGRARQNAIAAAIGWGVAIAAAFALSTAWAPADRVAAMSWANAGGVLVLGVVLTVMSARAAGLSAWRQAASLMLVTTVGAAVGYGLRHVPLPGSLQVDADSAIMTALGVGLLRGAVAAALTAAVLLVLPGTDLRRALRTVRRRTPKPEESS
ncbi:murein biosynthesis integral membrane protein MurJ [Blastococcus sp. Marseille-P5729]|uniref:murein biosynthesis integral membrane protein MurJ n=1 Tax=Blastococcus sp. Marseille-P5729 TaxID=2086582 RepID=UPI000D0EC16E|nr:lipid II flippase MurJ [Blastococcus sp. Marseille-P5729]